jgi:hypothetical protein
VTELFTFSDPASATPPLLPSLLTDNLYSPGQSQRNYARCSTKGINIALGRDLLQLLYRAVYFESPSQRHRSIIIDIVAPETEIKRSHFDYSSKGRTHTASNVR